MAFRKFQADNIFTGMEMLDGNHVLTTDEKGKVLEIVDEKEAGEDIQKLNGILSPGFINCHCHLELSHMKGLIPERTGLVDFVFKVVTQRYFPEEEISEAIKCAEDEMLKNGIVAVGDICNNLSTLPQKLHRNLHYQNFIEVSGWLPSVAEVRFERSKSFFDSFQKEFNTTSMVPHAPYSVSENLWEKLEPFFKNLIITIHNQETAFEDEFFRFGSGDFVRMYKMMNIDNSFFQPSERSSLQTYIQKLKSASSIILVHNTFTSQHDVEYATKESVISHQMREMENPKSEIRNPKLTWCLCINANQYIEDALPPVDMLRKQNCDIVVGTDSLASNHSLSVLDELKTIHQHFPSISLKELLQWATLNGAKALEINNKFGSFEKGKLPGIVLIDNLENNHLLTTSTSKRIL
ncbi:MAG TPA: amidohydrolase family protein [Segetibacter sp.]|jgi:cytosine/adenosine deaminase-related metal-dependent hydrolase